MVKHYLPSEHVLSDWNVYAGFHWRAQQSPQTYAFNPFPVGRSYKLPPAVCQIETWTVQAVSSFHGYRAREGRREEWREKEQGLMWAWGIEFLFFEYWMFTVKHIPVAYSLDSSGCGCGEICSAFLRRSLHRLFSSQTQHFVNSFYLTAATGSVRICLRSIINDILTLMLESQCSLWGIFTSLQIKLLNFGIKNWICAQGRLKDSWTGPLNSFYSSGHFLFHRN